MRNILIPTDFSATSEKAVEFGVEIAKRTGAKITLLNSFFIPVLDINVPPTMIETLYLAEEKKSKDQLEAKAEIIRAQKDYNKSNLICECICEQNTPESEIHRLVDKKNIDLVVMGTKGKESFLGLWRSITTETAKEISQPLLIVKEETEFVNFNTIDFAVENVREEFYAIKELTNFAKLFQSAITIVHVEKENKDNNSIQELTEETNSFLSSIKQYSEYSKINYRTIVNNDTAHGLIEYLEKTNGDLLAVIKYERNWLENIFHKSVIKNLIADSLKPILVIPRR